MSTNCILLSIRLRLYSEITQFIGYEIVSDLEMGRLTVSTIDVCCGFKRELVFMKVKSFLFERLVCIP